MMTILLGNVIHELVRRDVVVISMHLILDLVGLQCPTNEGRIQLVRSNRDLGDRGEMLHRRRHGLNQALGRVDCENLVNDGEDPQLEVGGADLPQKQDGEQDGERSCETAGDHGEGWAAVMLSTRSAARKERE